MHFAVRCFDCNFRIHVFSMSAAKFDDSIRTVLDGLVIFEAHDIVVLHVWRRAGFADKFQDGRIFVQRIQAGFGSKQAIPSAFVILPKYQLA